MWGSLGLDVADHLKWLGTEASQAARLDRKTSQEQQQRHGQ